ncbi:MAG: hypothetical protein QW128_00315 [Thermoprotei archaeon]
MTWEPRRAMKNRADENLRSKNLPALAVESAKEVAQHSRSISFGLFKSPSLGLDRSSLKYIKRLKI